MGKKIKKYVYIFIMALQSALEYRMNLFLSVHDGCTVLSVECGVYKQRKRDNQRIHLPSYDFVLCYCGNGIEIDYNGI